MYQLWLELFFTEGCSQAQAPTIQNCRYMKQYVDMQFYAVYSRLLPAITRNIAQWSTMTAYCNNHCLLYHHGVQAIDCRVPGYTIILVVPPLIIITDCHVKANPYCFMEFCMFQVHCTQAFYKCNVYYKSKSMDHENPIFMQFDHVYLQSEIRFSPRGNLNISVDGCNYLCIYLSNRVI